MKKTIASAVLVPLLIGLGLFSIHFYHAYQRGPSPDGTGYFGAFSSDGKALRKNYASEKVAVGPVAEAQRYERIANLGLGSRDFEADRGKIRGLIEGEHGAVQYERLSGTAGSRRLEMSIGIPPAEFDGFVEKLRAIGTLASIEIVKNDKTGEYRQLQANRVTLEKARDTVRAALTTDASVTDKLAVEQRLSQIEQELQNIGVSLGDFDQADPFCTVQFALSETRARPKRSAMAALASAARETVPIYGALGLIFLAFSGGVFLLALAGALVRRLLKQP